MSKKPAKKPAARAATKPRKPPVLPPTTPPPAALVVAPPVKVDEEKEESWSWTPEREKAAKHVVAGIPKIQIAEELKVHRNTIANWSKHPEFLARVRELTDDRIDTTRQRRHLETQIFTDKVAKLATKQLDAAIANPMNPVAVRSARDWLSEYRMFRAEERIDTGDNIAHVKHEVNGAVNHSHTLSAKSFKGFMQDALNSNVIDAECIEATDVHEVILQATQQALLEGSLLDDLAEEERHLKLDAHTQAERK